MNKPLVSVICLCYNHREFVVRAMSSVLEQTYENIELIIVDDASTDGSQELIETFCLDYPKVRKLLLPSNQGNCQAFNQGWHRARGKYLIDLAADDYLLPGRVALGVQSLEERGPEHGVHFTDVRLEDQHGRVLNNHRTQDFYNPVPEGDVFAAILERYFINPVSMMFSNRVLEELGGYDESLAYEDFDFWVRSSRKFKYCYTPEIQVVKRLLKNSHSSGQYKYRSKMLDSTLRVCQKAFALCENKAEYEALMKRIRFERRKALQSMNLATALRFNALARRVKEVIKE